MSRTVETSSGKLGSSLGRRVVSAPVPVAELEAEAWRRFSRVTVSVTDPRLSWDEMALLRQIGERLFGKGPCVTR